LLPQLPPLRPTQWRWIRLVSAAPVADPSRIGAGAVVPPLDGPAAAAACD